jgi:MFS family permease
VGESGAGERSPTALTDLSGRALLADRSVSGFLLAAACSTSATALQAATVGKQVFDITGRELDLGLIGLVEFLPAMLLVPITGSVADRFDRRRVGAIGLLGEVSTSIALCWYAATNPTRVWPIFVLAMLFGVSRAFAAPATRALPPLIGPAGGLPRIIAFYSGTWQFGTIVGPASSGLLYDIEVWVPYAVAAALFTLAAGTIITLRLVREQHRTPDEERPSLGHALEGLRFIRTNPVLLGAIALDLFAVLFGGAVALLPSIADTRLGVGNVAYGWLRAAPGIGAVLVTALLAVRPVRRRIGRVLLVVVAVFGAATIVFGLTRSYVVAFVALMILAGADAVSVFIRATLVPLATPDRMRGRVNAVENVFIGASNELGAFESGVTAAAFGVAPAVVLGGALTLTVVGVWWRVFPDLRRIDTFDEVTPRDPGGG